MKHAAFIALASAAMALTNSVRAEDAELSKRQLMTDQFMKSFCFANSWPRGTQVTNGNDGTTRFSALVSLSDHRVVRRTFSIANSELHALHQTAYVKHLTGDDLAALTRFCTDENVALKTAIEKKNKEHANSQLLNILKNDPEFAKFGATLPAVIARQKTSVTLTAQEADALAALRDSPEAKSAFYKIQNEIDPEISKAIWTIGKERNTETTRLYDEMPPKP